MFLVAISCLYGTCKMYKQFSGTNFTGFDSKYSCEASKLETEEAHSFHVGHFSYQQLENFATSAGSVASLFIRRICTIVSVVLVMKPYKLFNRRKKLKVLFWTSLGFFGPIPLHAQASGFCKFLSFSLNNPIILWYNTSIPCLVGKNCR